MDKVFEISNVERQDGRADDIVSEVFKRKYCKQENSFLSIPWHFF